MQCVKISTDSSTGIALSPETALARPEGPRRNAPPASPLLAAACLLAQNLRPTAVQAWGLGTTCFLACTAFSSHRMALLPKGEEGWSILNTPERPTHCGNRTTGATLRALQANSQPGASMGRIHGHILQMLCKISYLRLFKMKFFKAPPHLPKHGVR